MALVKLRARKVTLGDCPMTDLSRWDRLFDIFAVTVVVFGFEKGLD